MERNGSDVYKYPGNDLKFSKFLGSQKGVIYFLVGLVAACLVWYFLAKAINRSIILPGFPETMSVFFKNWADPTVMENLLITIARVGKGFLTAVLIGLPLGLVMGYSKVCREALSPVINSIRQVPIMAWIPMSIIWFGLGDGPTIFLITMSSVFPLMLNTIAGVINIDPNYKYAAKSMGAGTAAIFRDVILPGALPNFLVGCRLALGIAWMSVICAEFIATSKGFGFLMVEAQVRMQTPLLYSLMIMSALIGFLLDRILIMVERSLTSWRFKNASPDN